jgi:glutamate formiminotransferase
VPSDDRAPTRLVECVPNVSEGRDRAVVERLAAAVRSVAGVRLMNVHMDPDHHRSVLSFLGPPAAVEAAALALAAAVVDAIDMRGHRGAHPRIGALDVVPFVPLVDVSMEETVALARRVGARIAERHRLPVYYYGHAATRATRRSLRELRHGQYEGLAARLETPDGQPDDGPARFDPRSGAVLVGARDILVAFNVWLETGDLHAARAIAAAVRESGGGLPAVQAMGVMLASRGIAQVSMNLLDYRKTPIPAAFDRVVEEAARRGLAVRRGELVGLAPRAAFAGRSPASVGLVEFTPDLLLDTHLGDLLGQVPG